MGDLSGHVDGVSRRTVMGWAADRAAPERVVDVAVYVGDQEYARFPADVPRKDLLRLGKFGSGRHGFVWNFDKHLPEGSDADVTVRFVENGLALQMGHRTVRAAREDSARQLFANDGKPLPRPLLVTAMGRSGTTVLMQRLSQHPQIVAGEIYPFEVKLATYYANAIRVLISRGDHDKSEHPSRTEWEVLKVGSNPYFHPNYERLFSDPDYSDFFFRAVFPDQLSRVFGSAIRTFYAALARDRNKPDVVFFAEKSELAAAAQNTMSILFPEASQILVVRDIRDVYCSSRAYFGASDRLLSDMKSGAKAILALKADPNIPTIRYEDMVRDSVSSMRRLLQAVGLNSADPSPDAAADERLFKGHGTSEDPAASIGRWKTDLTNDEQALLNENFSEFLDVFDYERA